MKKRAGGRCERCKQLPADGHFEVHHLTYDRFKNERLTDLQGLCGKCHKNADFEREQENQENYEEAGRAARQEAHRASFFRTKYGEDWYRLYLLDGRCMDEEYDDWTTRIQERDQW